MSPVLELRNVTKAFGGAVVVDEVNLELNSGEFVALLGASGCGKSTTLRLLAGLDRPDHGQVLLDGQNVTARSASERNIALMFQSYALYPHLSVARNIAMPLQLRRLNALQRLPGAALFSPKARASRHDTGAAVRTMADQLGLEHLLDRKPAQLSGGQQQRVALARALVREPSAFLLDEPLSNLDTQLRADTRAEIKSIHRRTGCPFLLVTHDQSDALSMADRVAVMMRGRIVQTGTPKEIFSRPATIDVATFIGQHRMNILPEGQGASLHAAGQAMCLGVRPEDLVMGGAVGLQATVETVTFHGEETIVELRDTSGLRLRSIRRGAADLPSPGDTLTLTAQPHALHAFAADGRRQELRP